MGFKLNALTGLFDLAGSGGTQFMKSPVNTEADLPLGGNSDGDARTTLDTDYIWVWNNATSRWINTGVKDGTAGSTPNAQGYSITDVNVGANRTERRLVLQPADATNPGIVSTTTQTLAGDKTFNDDVTVVGTSTLGSVQVSSNQIATTGVNQDLVLNPNGTGVVNVDADTLQLGETTALTLSVLPASISILATGKPLSISAASGTDITSNVDISGTLEVSSVSELGSVVIGTNEIDTFSLNQDLVIGSNGTGILDVQRNIESSGSIEATTNVTVGQTLDVNGAGPHTFAGPIEVQGTATLEDNGSALELSSSGKDILISSDSGTGQITLDGEAILQADATNALGAVTKQQLDAAIQGVDVKEGVLVRTTANITLSGEQTIDGVLTSSSRVLVMNQSTQSENGIYVTAAGAWSRSSDANSASEINGAFVSVSQGTLYANTGWYQFEEVVTLGSDPVNFNQFFGAGTYTADGQGIEITGSTFSLELDGGTLSKSASGVRVANGGIADAQIAGAAAIDATKIADGSVTNTEFQYLGGVTSDVQTQINSKVTGPASATDNAVVRYDGTTGKLAQNSGLTVSDTGNISTSGPGLHNLGKFYVNDHNTDDVLFSSPSPSAIFYFDNAGISPNIPSCNSGTAAQPWDTGYHENLSDGIDTISFPDLYEPYDETSVTINNNQVAAANVYLVSSARRSVVIQYSIFIDATSSLYESGTLYAVQRGADWVLSQEAYGDSSLVSFDITSGGQIQYTSSTYAGYNDGTMKFKVVNNTTT